MSKNIDEQVDKLEAVVDPNSVISIGGYNFTPAKLMVAGAIVSSILGGLYGAFEVYKDYMSMKEAIQTYVTPDLSGLQEQLSVMKQDMKAVKESVDNGVQYTQDIKNDLKADIRKVESVVDSVERSSKQSQREVDAAIKEVQTELRQNNKEIDRNFKQIQREVDDKIKKALDNPLAGK